MQHHTIDCYTSVMAVTPLYWLQNKVGIYILLNSYIYSCDANGKLKLGVSDGKSIQIGQFDTVINH